MQIVYCYLRGDNDGASVHIREFISAFQGLGETVIPLPVRMVGQSSGGRRMPWGMRGLLVSGKALGSLVEVQKRITPDAIVFRHAPSQLLWPAIVYAVRVSPVVLEVNALRSMEGAHGSRMSKSRRWLEADTLRRVDACFAVSATVRDVMEREYNVPRDKIEVIANGVDANVFSLTGMRSYLRRERALEGKYVVGFVGSFKEWHGVDNVPKIAAGASRVIPNLHFVMVGDGLLREPVEREVERAGLQGQFTFTGAVEHRAVREWLECMDTVLAPYPRRPFGRDEFHGSPLKIFEYMSMSLPVIASPLGQIAEVIQDGVSGRLVWGEDTDGVVRELSRLHADATYRTQLGQAARARVEERYSWRANAEKVREVCLGAIRQRKGL